jgi:hypothetical protein
VIDSPPLFWNVITTSSRWQVLRKYASLVVCGPIPEAEHERIFSIRKCIIGERGARSKNDLIVARIRAKMEDSTIKKETYNESPKVVTPIGNNGHTLRFSKSRIARSWMPPKTGPIPQELVEPAVYFNIMTAQDSRALPRGCEWQALRSQNSQGIFLSEF